MNDTATAAGRAQQQSRHRLQQREERIARVLDATERFAATADDVEALTPTMIAELADVSVGWLYDHVGDRQTVVDLVLVRGMQDIRGMTVMLGLDLSRQDWEEQIDLLVEAAVNFLRTRRGYTRLFYSRLAGPDIPRMDFENDLESSRSFAGIPEDPAGPAVARAAAVMLAGILDKGLEISFRQDEFATSFVLDETKTAMKAYLRVRLGAPTA